MIRLSQSAIHNFRVADIVLTTLNAKFIHAAFGLRYLLANLGELKSRACIAEFDINQRPLDIAEVLLAQHPKIIGFGIYIWNIEPTTEVIAAIKRIRPEIKIILGGPEVSYETEEQNIVQLADHVITGEADLKFAEVCSILLNCAPLTLSLSPSDGERESLLVVHLHLYAPSAVKPRFPGTDVTYTHPPAGA
jgi:radical SAM superfamily enzyme YgiQ (UPF0313 family)